jgi:long-chain-fatty-acid--CoA ligase ACSBG
LFNGQFVNETVDEEVKDKINQGQRSFMHWDDFILEGNSGSSSAVKERIANQKCGQAATVDYTSGTTGNPKGVMLSHDSVTWAAEQTASIVSEKPKKGQHRIVSYLPLNHVAGQMLDVIYPLFVTQSKDTHATIFFPAVCFLRKTCFAEQLVDAKPTIFLGVPEVWDGLRLKIEVATASGLKKMIRKTAPSMVLKGVGLHKVMYAITGAGPITKDTLRFFHTMGINILNIFAQSESSALGTAWSRPDFDKYDLEEKFGSIGKPIGNVLKIDSETSEIMLKGRNVMLGYMNNMMKTQETITSDGWLKTGDKGRQDSDGFVFLVGRLKEIMKSHGGEMIAPVAIEEGIKKACNKDGSIIKQAIVQGDGKHYLSVLLTVIELSDGGIPTGEITGAALTVDPLVTRVDQVQKSKEWNRRITACITEANAKADKKPERVWRYAFLPRDITAESSPLLMTPTFKIRRDGVAKEYEAIIKSCGGDPSDGPLKGSPAPVQPCREVQAE